MDNMSGFQSDQVKKPPLIEEEWNNSLKDIPLIPRRVPVIVKNKLSSKEEFPDLNQRVKDLNLEQ